MYHEDTEPEATLEAVERYEEYQDNLERYAE